MILRFLLVFLIIYWISYLVRRFVIGPYKSGYQGQSRTGRGEQNYQQKPEGDISISYNPNQKRKKGNKDVGDYVDYEVIDDD
jgi:hypothetical protein